ncbi:hypothetical protein N7455_004272, partial [Penicillium solitum]|uniref:uncharacterized protein n=1 Tax=Penicillium solitum TaxID=60172 RepID=UPI0032C45521
TAQISTFSCGRNGSLGQLARPGRRRIAARLDDKDNNLETYDHVPLRTSNAMIPNLPFQQLDLLDSIDAYGSQARVEQSELEGGWYTPEKREGRTSASPRQALESSRERLTSLLDDWNYPSSSSLIGLPDIATEE